MPQGTANSPAAWKSIRAARSHGAPLYIKLESLSAQTSHDIRRVLAAQRKERARIRSENRGEEQHRE